MVTQTLDQEIAHSLAAFHTQFWSSIKGDDEALWAFLASWKSFEQRFNEMADYLQNNTLERVYSFSETVASVVQGLVDALSLSSGIYEEIPKFLEHNAFSHERDSSPSYIKVASEWLVANIHDPYPSPAVRDAIANKSKSPRKNIDNWFLDVRKRVGWNEMRRKRFDNKRASIVDAAKRFFLNADPSRPLPKAVESEFASIQMRAQEIYSDRFEESPIAVQLGRTIIYPMPAVKAGRTKSHKSRVSSNVKAARSYPTPQPSPEGPSSSLVLSPTPSLPELPMATPKRRASSVSEEEHKRPSKRQRTSVATGEASLTSSPTTSFSELPTASSKGVPVILPELDEGDIHRSNSRSLPTLARETPPSLQLQRGITFTSPEASLPSPVASTFDASELLPPQHHTDFNPASTLKRKRRLSESEDSLPNSKRRQASGMACRPQVPADPVPVVQQAVAVDFRWDHLLDFSQLPPPVSDWSAEIAGPVDVSLFDFSVWDDFEKSASNVTQGSGAPCTNLVETEVVGALPLTNLADDNLVFDWDSYGSPAQSSSSGNGYFNLDGVPCDFTSPPNQLTSPTSLLADFGCLPAFPVPLQPSLQNVPQPDTEPAVTIPKPGLKAKEEQLRALQAQVAALVAEIAAS